MGFDLGIEVSEVNFEEFERRKSFRGNDIFNDVQRYAYFKDELYEKEQIRIEVYSVIEVTFDQFERRKNPR